MRSNKATLTACALAAVVQALVINFVPLLYLHFHKKYDISLSAISVLIAFSFLIQLSVDIGSLRFLKKLGCRFCGALGQFVSFSGLFILGCLPYVWDNFFGCLMISTVLYSIGGRMVEVVSGPVIEGCPGENKEKLMSFVHSFYCWGQVGVIIISTAGFMILGIENWQIISILWSVVPLINFFMFLRVPIADLSDEFIAFVIMMICAGAAEQAMSQWASAFAEDGLKVSKAVGDIAGPCLFAALMGVARGFHSGYKGKIPLIYLLMGSGALCVGGFLIATLSGNAVAGLLGCGITGLAVGIMWPGSISA